MAQELTRTEAELVYRPLPGDDPLQRKTAITLATQKLDWKPSVPLRDGLRKTIAYFEEQLGLRRGA